jgi:predicted transcriptional regulator
LHLAIIISYLNGFEETGQVKLRPGVQKEFGINRHAAYRALKQLEEAGLIAVQRARGSAAEVTILDPEKVNDECPLIDEAFNDRRTPSAD